MTMSVQSFDSDAALSKEASDEKLWKMKPKMHMIREMCELQFELLGNPREFRTFTGVVSSMAHSRGGSATASTIPLRALDTHCPLSR